ncbi:hypothetical protein EGJ52_21605 [Pseudomonas luteola]|nr:hypothetical protein EGJ52_21605 [Pseudomonas luteola]
MPLKTEHQALNCNAKTLNRDLKVWWVHEMPLVLKECSGQLIPDTVLNFSSATAGGSPSLN